MDPEEELTKRILLERAQICVGKLHSLLTLAWLIVLHMQQGAAG